METRERKVEKRGGGDERENVRRSKGRGGEEGRKEDRKGVVENKRVKGRRDKRSGGGERVNGRRNKGSEGEEGRKENRKRGRWKIK